MMIFMTPIVLIVHTNLHHAIHLMYQHWTCTHLSHHRPHHAWSCEAPIPQVTG